MKKNKGKINYLWLFGWLGMFTSFVLGALYQENVTIWYFGPEKFKFIGMLLMMISAPIVWKGGEEATKNGEII